MREDALLAKLAELNYLRKINKGKLKMRKTVKDLKKWLENIDDDALISVYLYENNKAKEFIVATSWNENGKEMVKEFQAFESEE